MSLSTTTLVRAVGSSDLTVQLASATAVTSIGMWLYTDSEAMKVTALPKSDGTVNVSRGVGGTPGLVHAAGLTVYVGPSYQFYQQDPEGEPPTFPYVLPWINVLNGKIWTVSGTSWVSSSSGSGSAAFTKASAGVTTIITSTPVDRNVIISVQVTEVFADGDGAQPTFSIGQTGAATKFAATSVFTSAAAGATFSFSGVLTANTALIVTAVAGTGTTETGALTVTAVALS
jgi:hypothetical protein